MSLPRSGKCFRLVVPRGKYISTNQKHYPDLGSDASSVWNFFDPSGLSLVFKIEKKIETSPINVCRELIALSAFTVKRNCSEDGKGKWISIYQWVSLITEQLNDYILVSSLA